MFSFCHTSSLFPYISPLISRRGLQTHAKPRPEVVLANNSGLFFTYAALVAPNGRMQHPTVTCFVPPFSDIDPRYQGIHHGGMIASDQPGHGTVNIIDKYHQVINFTGLPYSATGLVLNKQLTQ